MQSRWAATKATTHIETIIPSRSGHVTRARTRAREGHPRADAPATLQLPGGLPQLRDAGDGVGGRYFFSASP